jgi:6,7-dimethyl-8-ribityllumazine synthase
MKEYVGLLQAAKNVKVGIVVARFNELITHSLLRGAVETLKRLGVAENRVTVAWVPGSLELPITAKKMAETGKFDALICLGAVIRGATAHFDVVVNQTASGLLKASLDTNVPIIMGVLTTDTIEQALERAGTKMGNKGSEAALAAIEMVNLFNEIERKDTKTQSS